MAGGIFLLRGDDDLVEMTEAPYDSEDVLQALIARYPGLLAGDQLSTSEPRRWLLVAREASLPSAEDGGGRWSVDHLFLDQDAIPTLVEVKRSSDTRIRREVVGQMLDYAANAVVYWPIERLRATFEANCESLGHAPAEVIADRLGDETDQEAFWERARTNLQAGKVRLVFVADEIPAELRRVIEFLNVQMSPAEVLGIEVRQYLGENLKTLVPRIVGQTAEAQQRKGQTPRKSVESWTWEQYRDSIDERKFRVVETLRRGVNAAIVSRALPWTEQLHTLQNGYIGYQRQGGYIVVSILSRRMQPELAVKLPRAPIELQLENPYPELEQRWEEPRRQWVWTIPNTDAVPDVGAAIDITARYQPESGPMAVQ
jgi:hypothetical protein